MLFYFAERAACPRVWLAVYVCALLRRAPNIMLGAATSIRQKPFRWAEANIFACDAWMQTNKRVEILPLSCALEWNGADALLHQNYCQLGAINFQPNNLIFWPWHLDIPDAYHL